jgi:predicted transposase YdaD
MEADEIDVYDSDREAAARERERAEQAQQALQQQTQNMARVLLESGATIEMVMSVTGLTQEELTDMQYEFVRTHNTASGT